MNRGMFEGSLVQQMIGGSPNWWCMGSQLMPQTQETSQLALHPSSSASSASSSSSSSASPSSMYPNCTQPSNFLPISPLEDDQNLPESWSQLLMGGLIEEEDRCSYTPFQPERVENWENQAHVLYPGASTHDSPAGVKQENLYSGSYPCRNGSKEIPSERSPWIQPPHASSIKSGDTASLSSNMLDFSISKAARKHPPSSEVPVAECNSTSGPVFKKGRAQVSSAQSSMKVRKEKLGDRITALHQLVSPFGKTDTASVLQEAIGYIRFLQNQIEALSLPYLGSASSRPRQSNGERSSIFPQDPTQDVADEPKKDLRSRGLCLVPVSFTVHVDGDNGADYWAPAFGGGFR